MAAALVATTLALHVAATGYARVAKSATMATASHLTVAVRTATRLRWALRATAATRPPQTSAKRATRRARRVMAHWLPTARRARPTRRTRAVGRAAVASAWTTAHSLARGQSHRRKRASRAPPFVPRAAAQQRASASVATSRAMLPFSTAAPASLRAPSTARLRSSRQERASARGVIRAALSATGPRPLRAPHARGTSLTSSTFPLNLELACRLAPRATTWMSISSAGIATIRVPSATARSRVTARRAPMAARWPTALAPASASTANTTQRSPPAQRAMRRAPPALDHPPLIVPLAASPTSCIRARAPLRVPRAGSQAGRCGDTRTISCLPSAYHSSSHFATACMRSPLDRRVSGLV